MIGVGDALIVEPAQELKMSHSSCGSDRWSQHHLLCHSHVKEASLLKGETQGRVLWHSPSTRHLGTDFCVPSPSTKAYFKDVFKGLPIKLYELKE